MDAMEFLNSKNINVRQTIWAFPPDQYVELIVRKINQLEWAYLKDRVRILLLVREKRCQFVRLYFSTNVFLNGFRTEIFQKGHREATKLRIKSQETFVLFDIGNRPKI